MKRYPHLVTFQTPTEVRSSSGGVTYAYANVAGLADLPARVVPATSEDEGERMVLTSDVFEIVVQGDRAVTPEMAALTDYEVGVFNVVRVARPTLRHGSPMSMATIVTAERIAL